MDRRITPQGVFYSCIIDEDVDGVVHGCIRLPCLVPRECVGRWVIRKGCGDPTELLWAIFGFLGRLVTCFEELSRFGRSVGVPRA